MKPAKANSTPDRVFSISAWLTPPLLLLAPFLAFLETNNYSLLAAGPWLAITLLSLAGLAVAALGLLGGVTFHTILTAILLVLLVDVQSSLFSGPTLPALLKSFGVFTALLVIALPLRTTYTKAAAFVSAVFCIVTIGLFFEFEATVSPTKPPQVTSKTLPSRVVHLVFDEHTGVEAIPVHQEATRALKARITQFYASYGFELFGGAYSRYSRTLDSLPNMLNYTFSSEVNALVKQQPGRRGGDLSQNRYFDDLRRLGFSIHVWQSAFLRYCSDHLPQVALCEEYSPWETSVTQAFALPRTLQLRTLMRSYARQSSLYRSFRYQYLRARSRLLARTGIRLPGIAWDELPPGFRLSTLNSLLALEGARDAILSLPEGGFLFAHILLPHAPYSLRADCSVKADIQSWFPQRGLALEAYGEQSLQLYSDQTLCLYSILDSLLSAMTQRGILADTLVVIQGDHGARLHADHSEARMSPMTPYDMIDLHATLFAVKRPRGSAAYFEDVSPLEELLRRIAFEELGVGQPPSEKTQEATVFEVVKNSSEEETSEDVFVSRTYPTTVEEIHKIVNLDLARAP